MTGIRRKGNRKITEDVTAGDNDKSFTIETTNSFEHTLEAIMVQWQPTATVGNRVPIITISQGTKVLYRARSPAAIAASTVTEIMFQPNCGFFSANNTMFIPLPPDFKLQKDDVIRITDRSNIDPADTVLVEIVTRKLSKGGN